VSQAFDRDQALLIRMSAYDITQALPRAAQTLEDMGYQVTILALDRTNRLKQDERVGNWRIIRYRYSYESGNKLMYFKAWFHWWKFVYKHLSRNSYAIVQASNLESIVPCIAAKARINFTLVFDVRDLWGMSIPGALDGKFISKLVAGVFQMAERWSARHVDAMVVNPASLSILAKYFGARVARNIPIAQVINVPLVDLGSAHKAPKERPFRVNFSGHISYLRNAKAIIDFARANPDVQVDVVGKVDDRSLRAELESQPNILLHGLVPYREAMEIFSEASLIALTYNVSTMMTLIGTPNKLFEAMMMGRPYVASIGGYLAQVADSAKIGWSIPYGDARALTELVRMLQEQPDLVYETGLRTRRLYESSFQWKDQQANLASLYRYVREGAEQQLLQQDGWLKIVGSTIESRGITPVVADLDRPQSKPA
jgi:glycosyltransferase involved in cell wall biosynthesis